MDRDQPLTVVLMVVMEVEVEVEVEEMEVEVEEGAEEVGEEVGEEVEEGGMEMMAAQRVGNGKVKPLLGQNVPVCPQQNILKTYPSLLNPHPKNPAMLHKIIRHPRQPRPEQG